VIIVKLVALCKAIILAILFQQQDKVFTRPGISSSSIFFSGAGNSWVSHLQLLLELFFFSFFLSFSLLLLLSQLFCSCSSFSFFSFFFSFCFPASSTGCFFFFFFFFFFLPSRIFQALAPEMHVLLYLRLLLLLLSIHSSPSSCYSATPPVLQSPASLYRRDYRPGFESLQCTKYYNMKKICCLYCLLTYHDVGKIATMEND